MTEATDQYDRNASFRVKGRPAPKGSWTAVTRTFFKASSQLLDAWNGEVALATKKYWRFNPMDGAVGLNVEIRIKRPKKHYRTGRFADVLRKDAPHRPIHDTTGDLSKFVRAVEDAMEGIAFTNDARVCMGTNVKLYADEHNPEGAFIHVWEIVE